MIKVEMIKIIFVKITFKEKIKPELKLNFLISELKWSML